MVAVKPGPIVCFDELQPLLEMPGQRQPAVVKMVKNPKAHFNYLSLARGSVRTCTLIIVVPAQPGTQGKRYRIMSSYRSRRCGFCASINSSFQARRHFLMRF